METQVDLTTQVTGKLSPENIDIVTLKEALFGESEKPLVITTSGDQNFVEITETPERIFLNGLLQIEGFDYVLDENKVIFLLPLRKNNRVVIE